MVKNGGGKSGYMTLNLTISQEWVDSMNWSFACPNKFSKA